MTNSLADRSHYLSADNTTAQEKLHTIAEAADCLGVHRWALRRAIKRGAIPSYTPFNSRRLVRLSEVVAFIETSRQGGGE
jgi:excisionase family DNA binding protein